MLGIAIVLHASLSILLTALVVAYSLNATIWSRVRGAGSIANLATIRNTSVVPNAVVKF